VSSAFMNMIYYNKSQLSRAKHTKQNGKESGGSLDYMVSNRSKAHYPEKYYLLMSISALAYALDTVS